MGDELWINVPKLAADGTNWVVYHDRMAWAMESRALADHLTNQTMPLMNSMVLTSGEVTGLSQDRVSKQDAVAGKLSRSALV